MADSYFEQGELWGKEPASYQLRVRQDILAILGDREISVLDVGCGDGFITNALPKSMRVTGVDSSAEALKHVKVKTVHASATELPFKDGSFDLVMCNDVLEHLLEADFHKALSELRRVASKWILITSPCMENLASGLTRCGACGEIYHVNHHQRAFGVKEIRSLFEGLSPGMIVFSGATISPEELTQRRLRAGLKLLTHWDLAVCPKCGQRASTGSPQSAMSVVSAAAGHLKEVTAFRQVDSSEFISVFSLGKEPLVELPPGGEGVSVLARQEGKFASVPAEQIMRDALPVIRLKSRPAKPESMFLRLAQGGTEFIYSSPPVEDDFVCTPAWFNSPDLEGMSSVSEAAFPSPAEAAAIVLGNALDRATAMGLEASSLRGRNEELLLRQGKLDKIEVDLQNLRAENDALKMRLGRCDGLEVEIQNLRAQNDALKLQAGRHGQIEVDLQNARKENDMLKLRLGQFEQLQVHLQNVLSENDALKLRAGQREQLEVDLQNMRAENAALRLGASGAPGAGKTKSQ